MTAGTSNGVSLDSGPPLPLARSIVDGTWRFALVSFGSFSVWAFAGKWLYRMVGEAGLCAVTAAVFRALAPIVLVWRRRRFRD